MTDIGRERPGTIEVVPAEAPTEAPAPEPAPVPAPEPVVPA